MSDHDNKCEFMLAPPDMNRLGLCLCKERALKARLAEAERLFKLTLRCLTDDEDGDVCHGRIRQFLRTTDADSAADSASPCAAVDCCVEVFGAGTCATCGRTGSTVDEVPRG